MGLAYVHLKYIEAVLSTMNSQPRVLFLGRQNLDLHDTRIINLIRDIYRFNDKDIPKNWGRLYADEIMLDCGWIRDSDSMDISQYEGATFIHDLNLPILSPKSYDLIIDGGTLEHIFNVPVALENISSLLENEGKIVHFSPGNNLMGHGFYQFSPELFSSFYSESNGFNETKIHLYDPKKKKSLFKVLISRIPNRSEIRKSGVLQVWCESTKLGQQSSKGIQQSMYLTAWDYENGVNPSLEGFRNRHGKWAPLLLKVKSNRWTYLTARFLNRIYKDFFSHKVSKWNLDLERMSWK